MSHMAILKGVQTYVVRPVLPATMSVFMSLDWWINESAFSSVVDLLLLAIRGVDAISKAFIPKVCVSFVKSTWLQNITRIKEAELQIASKNL